jgi:carboxyl-terminal processing protease
MDLKKIKGIKSFVLGAAVATAIGLSIQAKTTDSYFEISKNLDIFTSLFKELNTYYVDPIEPGKLVKNGIDAMLENLDPYTNYITESDIENFQFQTTGKYGGIGANMRRREDYIYVGDVQEFSPAQKAGLHPGDQVITIDNQPVEGKNLEEVSQLLKGSPGTQVSMRVKDAYTGAESVKMITRGQIELSSVPYSGFVGKNKDVGYVLLTQFTPGCSRHVRNALDSLKGVKPDMKGVVLDLRNNPGGLLDEAIAVCNLFIDRGQLVVSTRGKMKETDREYKTQGTPWNTQIPLTVIINNSSASASEIVAGTMQDLDRGVIVGERSYGKGLVQVTRPLGYNAQIKVTISRYYTPSGRCIQAIDYGKRNDDGTVSKIPDSLRKEYRTVGGRKVLSGAGIEPDVYVADDAVSKLLLTLYMKNYFFDYATMYAKGHPNIGPAAAFQLGDDEFNKFVKWLENKDYTYKTETEIALDSLKSIAQREKYFEAIKGDFTSLQSKVSHDKKQDLIKHKTEIVHFLENEIVSRYYYQRGRIENNLKSDNDLAKALVYLEQPTEYKAILKTGK